MNQIKRKNWLTLMLLSLLFLTHAQQEYAVKEFVSNKGEKLQYRELSPREIQEGIRYPLVLFLHGAGERGADNASQLTHGGMMFTNPVNRERFPSYVLIPQCPEKDFWAPINRDDKGWKGDPFPLEAEITTSLGLTKELLNSLLTTYPIDTNRIYLVGLSMGGMGTFDLVCRYPQLFAAAIPICGGVNVQRLRQMKSDTRFRIYHGDADNVVPVAFSRDAYQALKKSGKEVEYIEFPGVNHESWNVAFCMSNFMEWLYGQSKESPLQ